jgi:hypothetical protein
MKPQNTISPKEKWEEISNKRKKDHCQTLGGRRLSGIWDVEDALARPYRIITLQLTPGEG